ncbi:MAG: polysaccharide pyruvyl transferase CsaB [Cyanobacteria bacterium P01_A01_bin.84]
MRALLSGYYGLGNGGDEALLATLLQMLPPTVTPVVLTASPELTQQRYGVEVYERKTIPQVWKAIRSCDALILGGGSLIQDATSAMNPVYYSGLMSLAQRMGLKTIAWGQGIGPIKRPFTRWLARNTLNGCTEVSVRDRESAKLLSDWQIPHVLVPDPVWALESKPVPELFDLPAPKVAVTLRSHQYLTPKRLSNLTRALVDFQKATQTFIILLPFQKSKDLSIAEYIYKQLGADVSKVISIEEPRLLKGVYRGVEMTIGMRLHSLIMGAAEKCRCFALSYDPKVNRLMEDLDMPGWDLVNLPENPNRISKVWIEHYANGEAVSSEKLEYIVDRAFVNKEVLDRVLG